MNRELHLERPPAAGQAAPQVVKSDFFSGTAYPYFSSAFAYYWGWRFAKNGGCDRIGLRSIRSSMRDVAKQAVIAARLYAQMHHSPPAVSAATCALRGSLASSAGPRQGA